MPITREARAIPNAHVTGIRLPLTPFADFMGSSSECTQMCLGIGCPHFLNLFRRARASPSPVTLLNGDVFTLVGSVRKAAPIDEKRMGLRILPPSATAGLAHLWMRWALQSTESIASITKSAESSALSNLAADAGV